MARFGQVARASARNNRATTMPGLVAPEGTLIRFSCTLIALIWAACALNAAVAADTAYSSDYRYTDGAVAHAENICSAADLCGTIVLRRDDVISIYGEATLGCEPPTLHVVRRRGGQTLLSYQLVPQAADRRQASNATRNAAYGCRAGSASAIFDRGRVRMGVFPAGNGTLFVRFTAGPLQASGSVAPAAVMAP